MKKFYAVLFCIMVMQITARADANAQVYYGLHARSSGACFNNRIKKEKSGSCEEYAVCIWGANYEEFNPADTRRNIFYSWVEIFLTAQECGGTETVSSYMFADLTKKPSDKNDIYVAVPFAQGSELRVKMPIKDQEGIERDIILSMKTFPSGDLPEQYQEFGASWTFHQVFDQRTSAVATLRVDGALILKDIENSSPGFSEDRSLTTQ